MFQQYFSNLRALSSLQLFYRFGLPFLVSVLLGLLSVMGSVYDTYDNHTVQEAASTWLFSFLISISIWISNQELGNILFCYSKLQHQDLKRGIIQTSINMVLALLVAFSARELSHLFFNERIDDTVFKYTLSFALLITLLINTMYILAFFFRKWKEEWLKAEHLKQEHLKSQLYALRQQLDPHFLFNALSALQELISENGKKAHEFVEDLAVVYRYILDHKEDDWVSLTDEIEFMKTYLKLLQHKTGNMLTADFPKELPHKQIPVLAGQLLIENVLKHNIIDSKNPMHVRIWLQDEHLWVANTLRPKNNRNELGLGLDNLQKRYKMLCENNIIVQEKETIFQVGLPLN